MVEYLTPNILLNMALRLPLAFFFFLIIIIIIIKQARVFVRELLHHSVNWWLSTLWRMWLAHEAQV